MKPVDKRIKELEKRIKSLEIANPDSLELADALETYAGLLRSQKRLLEAVNTKARADVIRASQPALPAVFEPENQSKERDPRVLDLYKPKQRPTKTRTKSSSNTKVCPYCAERIKRGAMKCRYCGSEFQEQAILTDQQREALKDMYICLSCEHIGFGKHGTEYAGTTVSCALVGCLLPTLCLLFFAGFFFWPLWIIIPILLFIAVLVPLSQLQHICSKCEGKIIPVQSSEGLRRIQRMRQEGQ